jgi:protein subunit release factor B
MTSIFKKYLGYEMLTKKSIFGFRMTSNSSNPLPQNGVNSKPPRMPIILVEGELEEKFTKGSGPGGQKINKCQHCVQLKHIPTGIKVETQRFRELSNNRKEARKLLILQLDRHFNGQESKIEKKIQKTRKANQRQKRRAAKKYGNEDDDEPDHC